jgi:glucose-1-phosphatase
LNTNIELVAFDLGNVLCSVNEMPVAEDMATRSGHSTEDTFEIIFSKQRKLKFESGEMTFVQHAEQAISTLGLDMSVDEFTDLYDSVLIPSENMFPLVSRIGATRRLALVSNTSEPHWKLAERFLPFSAVLDPVIVSYEVESMKPDKAFYDALLEQSGVPAGNILFVDDLVVNIAAARSAGMIGHLFESQSGLEAVLVELGII